MSPAILLLVVFLLLSKTPSGARTPGPTTYPPGAYPPGVVPPGNYYPPGGYYPGQQTAAGAAATAVGAGLGYALSKWGSGAGVQPPSAPVAGGYSYGAGAPSNFSTSAPYEVGAGAYVPYAPGASSPGPYAPGYVPQGSGDGLLAPTSYGDASTSSDTSLWYA